MWGTGDERSRQDHKLESVNCPVPDGPVMAALVAGVTHSTCQVLLHPLSSARLHQERCSITARRRDTIYIYVFVLKAAISAKTTPTVHPSPSAPLPGPPPSPPPLKKRVLNKDFQLNRDEWVWKTYERGRLLTSEKHHLPSTSLPARKRKRKPLLKTAEALTVACCTPWLPATN